jgi:hypothetical protein
VYRSTTSGTLSDTVDVLVPRVQKTHIRNQIQNKKGQGLYQRMRNPSVSCKRNCDLQSGDVSGCHCHDLPIPAPKQFIIYMLQLRQTQNPIRRRMIRLLFLLALNGTCRRCLRAPLLPRHRKFGAVTRLSVADSFRRGIDLEKLLGK